MISGTSAPPHTSSFKDHESLEKSTCVAMSSSPPATRHPQLN